jgi:hypothetical protein
VEYPLHSSFLFQRRAACPGLQIFLASLPLTTNVRQKVTGFFQKKRIYRKNTEMKLISLFNVIPQNFNAPVLVFRKFLIPSEKSSPPPHL